MWIASSKRSVLDPAGADEFASNAYAYKQELKQFDQELRALLATLPKSAVCW